MFSKKREIFHQSLALMTVCLNEFALGVGNGWIPPTLSILQNSGAEKSLTMEEASWIASLEHIGKIFGALLTAFLLDIIGRKKLLTFSALSFAAMWCGILCSKSVLIIYLSRILFGLAYGVNDGTNSVYLGENSSPIVRGVFGSVTISLYYFGLLLELAVAGYFSVTTTAIINSVIMFSTFLCTFWMVEPAQFLLMKGKSERAKKNFLWLKGVRDISEVQHEFEKIQQNANAEITKKSSYMKIFTSPANYKSVLIMFAVYVMSGSTGYYPIMSFASVTFSSTEILTQNQLIILFGICQFVVGMVTSFVIDKFNRRSIMLVGYTMICIVHAFTAILYYVQDNLTQIPYFPWLTFVSITVYAMIYAFVYPAVFLIRSELFPLSVKAVGGCIAVVGYSLMSFLMTKIFLYVSVNFGIHVNFIMFSCISLTLAFFIYFLVPETRNKSLIEIQEILEKEN
ncbi:facilitated trehalose transporter Tret1-like isoform X5 [Planococcus citri]|uniref:facilitated trehalose transporter Tret1-like isoform X5 n=1 Tax=Planococcus citri TaxID=170843 RepID=UPI0031F8213B